MNCRSSRRWDRRASQVNGLSQIQDFPSWFSCFAVWLPSVVFYRITGVVWGEAPKDIVQGEQWSVGHVPLILLGAVLVGFCWALPPPLQQLFEAAATLLVNH